MDRNRHMATRTSHPSDNVHSVVRTSRYHFAAMRRAQDTAHGLSVQYSARHFAATFDPNAPRDSLPELKAIRDSYYLLAAAHHAAARKRERRENRALAWTAFKEGPAVYAACAVRSWAYRLLGAVTR
jgi:hypothetical protein